MAIDPGHILAAALSLRVGADTTGLEAEVASKLTAAERRAAVTADRVSASAGKIAESGAVASQKLQIATLRQTAAQESYNRLLREGETDTVRLARAQASLLTSQRAVANEQRRIDAQAASTGRRGISPLGLAGGLAGFAALTAASRVLHTGVQELSDYQTGLAQATSGITSTGGAANVTADQVEKLAHQIQAYSGYTDDAVVASEDLLLTFPRVRNEAGKNNDIFTRSTVAAADLARRGFGDLSSNAKALGKALSDPVAGLTALRRSGITFTQAQRDQIKSLVESNNLLGAQRLILNEVNREAGGSARAFGETLPGKLAIAHRSFEDLSQGLITDVEPALSAAAKAATFLGEHEGLVKFGLGAASVAGGLILATKVVKSYRDVVDTLFTRTGERVAANTAVAASYDAVAVSAGAAARAETAAATAGLGGAAGGAGVLGEMAALRATIPAGRGAVFAGRFAALGRLGLGAAAIADPMLIAAMLAGGDQTSAGAKAGGQSQQQLLSQFAYRNGAFYAGGQRVNDPRVIAVLRASGIGPGLDDQTANADMRAYGNLFTGTSAQVLGAQNRVLSSFLNGSTPGQVATTNRRSFSAALNSPSSYDIFSRAASLTPRVDPSAASALASARTRAGDASRAVGLAEARLSAVRANDKATTLQVASAEEAYRKAKERSAKASQDVKDAEGKAHAARLATAQSLVRTLGSQQGRAASDLRALERIESAGVHNTGVLQMLIGENNDAPGTLQSIARTITPKVAQTITSEFRHLRSSEAARDALLGTSKDWSDGMRERVRAAIAAGEAEFADADLSVAVRRTRVNLARQGRTGSYNQSIPGDTRRRRALSGTPTLPHGA